MQNEFGEVFSVPLESKGTYSIKYALSHFHYTVLVEVRGHLLARPVLKVIGTRVSSEDHYIKVRGVLDEHINYKCCGSMGQNFHAVTIKTVYSLLSLLDLFRGLALRDHLIKVG